MSQLCRRIADNESFQTFILFLILLTAASMGLETVPELVDEFASVFDGFYYFTQTVFALEIAIRLLAYAPRPRNFFKDRTLIKRQKYALLSNWDNLSRDGRKNLEVLFAANKRLNKAYILKESFGQLWSYHRE